MLHCHSSTVCLQHCMWVVCHSIIFRSIYHVGLVQSKLYMKLQNNYKRRRVKLSLCMPLRNIQGVEITQILLNLSTRQRWVWRQCYLQLLRCAHWIGGQGCPGANLNCLANRQISWFCQESNPRSSSLSPNHYTEYAVRLQKGTWQNTDTTGASYCIMFTILGFVHLLECDNQQDTTLKKMNSKNVCILSVPFHIDLQVNV
jgi:hypothetical protein